MADLPVKMILRAYDYLTPLFLGDAPTPGVRLGIDHRSPLTINFTEDLDIAEVSFNRYIIAYARGNRDLVGLPVFVLRGFRHRNFFVRSDSPLAALADLKGKRVGTNSWPDTGTMWARAAMRDAGVEVEDVSWVLGTLNAKTPNKPPSPHDAQPPKNARMLSGAENLLDELKAGRIDAVTTAFAPEEVFQKGGWIRRLVKNYREVEADYHRRTGVYPGFHVVAARRGFVEKHPEAIMAIYKAMLQAYGIWTVKVRQFAEASPWAMDEYETMLRDFGEELMPFGMETGANQRMVATMCHEQHAQKLVDKPARPEELFKDFEAIRKAG